MVNRTVAHVAWGLDTQADEFADEEEGGPGAERKSGEVVGACE